MLLRLNCASNPNGSLTVTQKHSTFWGRLHLGLVFLTVIALRPSKLRSSGASRWTRLSLEIMVMPLQALCVFKHRTLSLHPCCVCECVCVCVCVCVCLCVRAFLWHLMGKMTVHEGYLVKHMKFWKDVTFLTLQNSYSDPYLRHFRLSQEAYTRHTLSLG